MPTRIKRLSILAAVLFFSTGLLAQDDAIGKYFGKYIDDSRFSVISVSPKMFRLLSKVNWDTIPSEIKQTVTKLQSLRIISTETTPRLFYKEALSDIDKREYEDLITVRDKTDDVHFSIKETGGVIHELLMLSVDDQGFTMISFVGDIDLDKLARLTSSLDIKGMENLKNAKRKNK